jgi:hypothetical protein
MKNKKAINILVFCIVIAASAASLTGIFSNEGRGAYPYKSIRGKDVIIYGKGLYRDMSAEVAVQGIAQDYVTFFVGIPLLIIFTYRAGKGCLQSRFVLAGVIAYFLVTYLFYTVMGMYNVMFLCYVAILAASFFSFILTILTFDIPGLPGRFAGTTSVKFAGRFLIFNAAVIALLWLSIVVPPLFDGTVVPVQAEHYTTLIVQGLDLGILLPASAVSGLLVLKGRLLGYLLIAIYIVFLSLLMTALTAKVAAMGITGADIFPVIIIIPFINIISVISAFAVIRNIDKS